MPPSVNHTPSAKQTDQRVTRVSSVVYLLFGCLMFAGPGCAAFRPIHGVPAKYLPDQYKSATRSGKKTIDLSLLRQTPPPSYQLDTGDILGVYIEGILGSRDNDPPVFYPRNEEVPPSFGYPRPVRDDGTISLPMIDPIYVRGMSIHQLENHLRVEYIQKRQLLQPGNDRILVMLQKPRTYSILVIRQEAGYDSPRVSAQGTINLGMNKRGMGKVVNLPAYKNDVLNALAETGGLPGLDAENTIYIVRRKPSFPMQSAYDQQYPAQAPSPGNWNSPAVDPRQYHHGQSPHADPTSSYDDHSMNAGHAARPSQQSPIQQVDYTQPSSNSSSWSDDPDAQSRVEIDYYTSSGADPYIEQAYSQESEYGAYHDGAPIDNTAYQPAYDQGYGHGTADDQSAYDHSASYAPAGQLPSTSGYPSQRYAPPGYDQTPAMSSHYPAYDAWSPADTNSQGWEAYDQSAWGAEFAGFDPTIDNRETVKIPVRLSEGDQVQFNEQDIILQDGDVVFIESRDTEIFYTGGLLGGGQYSLPRDYDLDILGAISIAQSQGSNQGRSMGGVSALNQDVTISASRVIVLRQLDNGGQIPIEIDLYEALRNPRERILVHPGDYILLQYTPLEAIGAFIERNLLEGALFGLATSTLMTGNGN